MPEDFQVKSVSLILLGEMFKMLIEKDLLNEGDVIARLERVSVECGGSNTRYISHLPGTGIGTSAAEAVGQIQIVRDIVAGEVDRKPS